MSLRITFLAASIILCMVVFINYYNYGKTNDVSWMHLAIIVGIASISCMIVSCTIDRPNYISSKESKTK